MSQAPGYSPSALPKRIRAAAAERGARQVAAAFARWGTELIIGLPRSRHPANDTFAFAGAQYPYLYHRYNFSWLTERAVEVPVVQSIVDAHGHGPILEVGHVLGHYRPQQHVVVDKYEQAAGVLNHDVRELEPLGRFSLIVAISTLEHVGRDEQPQDPDGAAQAMAALRDRLTPEGRLIITIPAGYNPHFDAYLRDGEVEFRSLRGLVRERPGPHWREVDPADAWSVPYDFLLYSARAVLIGELGPSAEG